MRATMNQMSVESLAATVTGLVAEVESCESLELPPLYNAVDVDALHSLCAHAPPAAEFDETGGVVSFSYSDSLVRIDTGEPITVTAALAENSSPTATASTETVERTDTVDDDHSDSFSHPAF